MNLFNKHDYLITSESSIILTKPYLLSPATFPFDLIHPTFPFVNDVISPFADVTTITDLISSTTRRHSTITDLYLTSLSDRVSALELAFDSANSTKSKSKVENRKSKVVDRKYTWTAEINSLEKEGVDRKYKVVTEIKGGKKKERSCKWTAEIKRKGDDVKKYSFMASSGVSDDDVKSENREKEKKKKEKRHRIVEIQGEVPDHSSLLLKQAFDRALERNKGKKKELSPQDAATLIQMTFRAFLIKRSQALRALRELAVAKGKLKELRGLFNNFSYRRKVSCDAEERQKFSEKVIVLLLTVDAIEGADIMARAAKRSMVDELEAMLDVVDPQPGGGGGRSLSMKRRTFDLPDGVIQKELAAGVAQVVGMLGQENPDETFEACL